MLNVPGFSIEARIDRKDTSGGIGGGILVYVRNGLTILYDDNSQSDFNQYCKFKIKNEHAHSCDLDVLVIYRSPNSSPENNEALCKLIDECDDKNSFIIGDLNFPGIKWAQCVSDSKGQGFYDAITNKGLYQHVDFPTHTKGNTLDLVITSNPDIVQDIQCNNPLGKSDHFMLEVTCDFSTKINKTTEHIFDWRRADTESLRSEFSSINWQAELEHKNAEESWQLFTHTIDNLTEKFVPTKLRRNQNKPIWMTQNVMRVIRKKKRLFKHYSSTKEYRDYLEYKKAENQVKKTVRNAKKSFEKNLSKKGRNDKKFYSYCSSQTKSKPQIGPLNKNDGSKTNEDNEVCDLLNDFFSSVFSAEGIGPIPDATRLPSATVLNNLEFNEATIRSKIDKLKPNTSPGPDKISAYILKEIRDEISLPLSIIFKKSLEGGVVPDDWKKANVVPIFKKGSKSKVDNYRPISLTSLCCKIMESIIRDAIVDHLTNNDLISDNQHGFMRNRSCLTNLLEFLETLTSCIDDGFSADLIFLDFAKAFDKVPRLRLLNKLKAHSIDGLVLNWIESWLTGRSQRVVLNGECSEWKPVESGVPQGSVLGPICFVIFINDLDDVCQTISMIKKFADDTKLCNKIINDDDRKILQQCLDDLLDWANKWGMSFNISKCKVMHIGNKNPNFTYEMNGHLLETVAEEKDVGVFISSSLKPSLHCKKSVEKANRALFCLKKAFHYRDKKVFIDLYKTYVRPHLEYCSPAWNPWSKADADMIEGVQKRVLRMVSGLNSTSYAEKLLEVNLQSLSDRRLKQDMCETFKILKGFTNVESRVWFEKMENAEFRTTRLSADPNNLKVKACRTEIRRNFFSYRVINKWNSLPSDIKNSTNIKQFKRQYDEFIKRTV